jgi:hypothetical protein
MLEAGCSLLRISRGGICTPHHGQAPTGSCDGLPLRLKYHGMVQTRRSD